MAAQIKDSLIYKYRASLRASRKSPHTIEKYLRDVSDFRAFIGEQEITAQQVQAYRDGLIEKGLAKSSVNSMMISLNSLFRFMNRPDLKVCNVTTQADTRKECLTEEEFQKLCHIAEKKGKSLFKYLIQVIRETGLRISELSFVTATALRKNDFFIRRGYNYYRVEIKTPLRESLIGYAKRKGITRGSIFVTAKGKPLDRSNVWRKLREFARIAGIPEEKVSPDNLRLVGNEQIEVSAD